MSCKSIIMWLPIALLYKCPEVLIQLFTLDEKSIAPDLGSAVHFVHQHTSSSETQDHVLSITWCVCVQTAAPACDEGHLSISSLLAWARLSLHVPSHIPLGLPGTIHSLIQHTAIYHCDSQSQTSFIMMRERSEVFCTVLSLYHPNATLYVRHFIGQQSDWHINHCITQYTHMFLIWLIYV